MTSVSLSPDTRWALSGSVDKTLRLWDVSAGRCVRAFEGHSGAVTSVCLAIDSRLALSGSVDKTLRVWDVSTGRCVRMFEGDRARPVRVRLSGDGDWAVEGSDGKTLRRICAGHTDYVRDICLSADGRWALSGSNDKTLRLWDVDTGDCVRTFEGFSGAVRSLCLSTDACWALLGSSDNVAYLWELDWEYDFRGWSDWHEGARAYLADFLTSQTPYAAPLPQDGHLSDEEAALALTRRGRPTWTEEDLSRLLYTLSCAGYGWLRPEGVRRKLEEMAAEWQGPPPLAGDEEADEQASK